MGRRNKWDTVGREGDGEREVEQSGREGKGWEGKGESRDGGMEGMEESTMVRRKSIARAERGGAWVHHGM